MIEKQKKHRFAESVGFSVPYVRELVQPVQSITLDMAVLDVLQLFQDNPNLPAFPIIDADNNYFGIASRRNYLNIMTKAFARELFARKDVVYGQGHQATECARCHAGSG